MKPYHIFFSALLALGACAGSPTTQNKESDTTFVLSAIDSMTYTQQRSALTTELESLVDAYDKMISQVKEKDSVSSSEVINQLEIAKDRVERDLQEVNTTAMNGWDTNYVERIEMSIKENENELQKLSAEFPIKN